MGKSTKEVQEKPSENSEELKSCFIITPIGEANSEINQKAFGLIKAVIQPVLKKYKYQPIAASEISNPGSINKQIIIKIYEDDLVIANLTGLNPNVMYELAIRHAVRKPIIIMAEKGTKLPFDIVDQRCIFYEDNLHGVEIAKEQLDKFLINLDPELLSSNPIYDSIKEDQIIQKVTSNDDPTQYVLSRLDRIENALVNFNNFNPVRSTVTAKTSITFTISPINTDIEKCLEIIQRIIQENKMGQPIIFVSLDDKIVVEFFNVSSRLGNYLSNILDKYSQQFNHTYSIITAT